MKKPTIPPTIILTKNPEDITGVTYNGKKVPYFLIKLKE